MNYLELTLCWDKAPQKLNRTLLVRSDLDIYTIAVAILTTLRAGFAHPFYFVNGDDVIELTKEKTKRLPVDKLGQTFNLVYKTKEAYTFNVSLNRELISLSSRRYAFLKEANGIGLFEENIESLLSLVKEDSLEVNETKKVPWNLTFLLPSLNDFAKPLNIVLLDQQLQNDIKASLLQLEEQRRLK